MMKINTQVTLPFPRDSVWATYRNNLPQLAPYLSNVNQIEVQDRQEQDHRLHLVLTWHGGGDIPVPVRALLSPAMLSWTDISDWDDQAFITHWQIKTHAFNEAVHCAGKNIFLERGNQTLIHSQGSLTINPQEIKGVPGFMAGIIAQAVEDYLGQKIEPNFHELAQAVGSYLAETT